MVGRSWWSLVVFPIVLVVFAELTGFALVGRSGGDLRDIAAYAAVIGAAAGIALAVLYVSIVSRRSRRLRALRSRFPESTVVNAVIVGLIDRRYEPPLPPVARAVRRHTGTSVSLEASASGIALWSKSRTAGPFVTFPWDTVRSAESDMLELVLSRLPLQAANVQHWAVLRVIADVDGTVVDIPLAVDRDGRGDGAPNPLDEWALRPLLTDISARRAAADGISNDSVGGAG